MTENLHKRGSVLMEFILVIPIYIVLLAGLFTIGDSLIEGTELVHEERILSFNGAAGDGIQRRIFHADTGVRGAWTRRMDIKKTGRYQLPGYGVAGMLLFGDQTFRGEKEKGVMRTLIDGGLIDIFSKDNDGSRRFNIYTLQRNRIDTGSRYPLRDNRRHPSQLLCAQGGVFEAESWHRHVYGEGWHDVIDDAGEGNDSEFPVDPGLTANYRRFPRFIGLLEGNSK